MARDENLSPMTRHIKISVVDEITLRPVFRCMCVMLQCVHVQYADEMAVQNALDCFLMMNDENFPPHQRQNTMDMFDTEDVRQTDADGVQQVGA